MCMVATAELIPKNPQNNEYKVTVVGNISHDNFKGTSNGIFIKDFSGFEGCGMEGRAEFLTIDAQQGYDIIVEENEYGQFVLEAVLS